jgi:alkanesulfonate monooxygenase SsuD/methylene tetrahydromethanopterin reductase-like flavin-dependent oxidoreductase (luciferase family)
VDLCLMIEGQEGVTWPQWVGIARACEEHGVPGLFRSDHYLNLADVSERGSLDAWGTLCGLAAVTTSLRLGTMVSPTSFRHPSALAKLVTTADHVSGGRIDVGIGAGWNEREHEAYGFVFRTPRERTDMLEEQLEILVRSWGDGPFSFAGVQHELRELDAQPKPVQRPHPPIILGGSAGKRGVRLAVAYADEYNTPEPTIADVKVRRARIHAACEQAGREPIPFSIMTPVLVGDDERDLRARANRLGAMIDRDPISLLREPPAGWLIGSVCQVAEQLIALRDAGVSRVLCAHLVHDDLEGIELIGQRLAGQII